MTNPVTVVLFRITVVIKKQEKSHSKRGQKQGNYERENSFKRS